MSHSSVSRQRRLFLLSPILLGGLSLPSLLNAASSDSSTIPSDALPSGACPLNSGGPSLLNTRWRLAVIYGNSVPPELDITMKVGENSLQGFAGCNTYSAAFSRVGYTGFRMLKIGKTKEACPVLRPRSAAPTVNVGDWEGSFLRNLGRMGSVRQEGPAKLWFFNRNGEVGLVFLRRFGTGTG